jgi:integrase
VGWLNSATATTSRGAAGSGRARATYGNHRSNRSLPGEVQEPEHRAADLAKYKTFTNQLRAYAESRGYVYLDQLTVADMDRFYGSWNDGIRSKAKKLERLKSFVKFCLKREWLHKDIADDLEASEGASVTVPKAPFTDEELNRIFAACDAIGMDGFGPNRRNWMGEDVKDFILLSIYTGMRISDVATFEVAKRLSGNNVFLRMHKTRKPLYTWIPDWLVARLRARQQKHGSLIFRCGVTLNMKQLTDIWRNKRLHKVFKLAGPFEEKATPHRFRHTFVRILLEKGVPVPDVAELIGDTEEIVRKHYSRWITSRQDRLTRILQQAFEDKPTPKVVAINRGA